MIELENLTKQYGLLPVLRGVDLSVAAGEFVTLVGPNGAGKTTLLRIVATLLSPSGGLVKIGGWPLPSHAAQVRGHIGLVSHQTMLYGDMTAAENLRYYARLYGVADGEKKTTAVLKTVGLAARQYDFVRTFSRGMLQRLTIARATLHEPDVLLLDEPYTGLDQAGTALLDELLREQHGRGRTILMITHDLLHGLTVCDRVCVLHRGKIALTLPAQQTDGAEFLATYKQLTGQ
jgi:heme exporter protein A